MCVVFATDEGGAVVIGRSRVATKPDRKSTAGHAGPRQGASIAVGLIGLVIGAAVALNILAAYDWDTSVFIKFGARDTARQAYAERWLGPDIELAPNMGHDGKFFFMQAMDPFYLEPDEHSAYLDRPTYRARRMLYPTVASMGGLLGAGEIPWSLIVVNVLGLGIGTYFTSRLAVALGGSAWLGLAFALNLGLVFEMTVNGSGAIATAGLMAGILGLVRGRPGWGIAGLTAAALARETMILAAVGVVLLHLWRHRRVPDWRYAVPFAALGGWSLYVWDRVAPGVGDGMQLLDLPFSGFFRAIGHWVGNPALTVDMLVGLLLMGASLMVMYRAFRTPTMLGAATAGLAALTPLMAEPSWLSYFDSLRIVGPVVTAFVLLTLTRHRPDVAEDPVPV